MSSGIESALNGELTRDATAKVSAKGKRYTQVNLRVECGDTAHFANVLIFDDAVVEAAAAGKLTRGTSIYCEGKLQIHQWCGNDGVSRIELKMLARYCRIPEIGRNRPKKPKKAKATTATSTGIMPDPDLNDAIPDLGGVS